MSVAESSAFTDDEKYFGTCSGDGKLKVWDTSSGILHQEFTPDCHLTSPCSCLTWIVTARNHGKRKKTSLKGPGRDNSSDSGGTLDIAALGTATGSIHLYCLATGKVEGLLNGHKKRVNHLSWSKRTNLFSCGEDKVIIEWNITTQDIVSKFKTGKEGASCILVLPDGKSLISAQNTIRWWDLETKKVIKTYTGHASPVVTLTYALGASNKGEDYLLSGARDDIYLSAWSLNAKSEGKTGVVASFAADEPPKSISIISDPPTESTWLATVTIGGKLQLFRHKLNGKCDKPLKPALTVQMVTSEKKGGEIPFANAKLVPNNYVLVACGNRALFSFERIETISKEKWIVLSRSTTNKSPAKKTESITKVKVPGTDGPATYLQGPKRMVNGQDKSSDMPMEHRLQVLALNTPTHDIFTAPTGSMAHQLLQGLYSKNEVMLRDVLTRREPDVITNTVSMLPVQAIVPIIHELTKRIRSKYQTSKIATLWLRSVLSVHASQLLAAGDMTDLFSETIGVIETKLQILPPLTRLRGRLNLLVDQIGMEQSGKETLPILDYQNYIDNASSDEGSDLEGIIQEGDSEGEQWDEQAGVDGIDGTSDSDDQDVEMME